jgi:hypothetical protein
MSARALVSKVRLVAGPITLSLAMHGSQLGSQAKRWAFNLEKYQIPPSKQ